MTERETLEALIRRGNINYTSFCNENSCKTCKYSDCDPCTVGYITDYLINNGVKAKEDCNIERKPFCPNVGEAYENAGGGIYLCVQVIARGPGFYNSAIMQNVKSGWTLKAHGIGIYQGGKIDWDFSTGGHFEEVDG